MSQFKKSTNRYENDGDGYIKPEKPDIILKLKLTDSIRIRLVTEPTRIKQHAFNDSSVNKGNPLVCLTTLEKECPICQYLESVSFRKDDDEDLYNKWKYFQTKNHYIFNVINKSLLKKLTKGKEKVTLDDIKNDIQISAINASMSQYQELKTISALWGNHVWDVEHGLDLRMFKIESSNKAIHLVKYEPFELEKDEDTGKGIYPIGSEYPISKLERNLSGYFAQKDYDDDDYDFDNEREVIKLFFYQHPMGYYDDAVYQLKLELGTSSKSSSSPAKNKDKRSSADSEEEFKEYVKPSKPKKSSDDDDDDGKVFKKSTTKKPIDDDEEDDESPPADDDDDEPVKETAKKSAKKFDSDDDIPF